MTGILKQTKSFSYFAFVCVSRGESLLFTEWLCCFPVVAEGVNSVGEVSGNVVLLLQLYEHEFFCHVENG